MLLQDLKDMLNRDGADSADRPAQRHPLRPSPGEVLRHVLLLPGSPLRRRRASGTSGATSTPGPTRSRRTATRSPRPIACLPDEPRYIGDQDVFVLQDKVIEHILAAEREAEAKAAAPTAVDPIQQTVTEEIKDAIRRRTVDREKAKTCIGFLGQPMGRALHVKLREAFEA